MREFSVNLRSAMEQKSVSQAELSRLTGISKSFISQYLSGKFKPKADKLSLLSKALDVSEAELLGLDNRVVRKNYTTQNIHEVSIYKNNEIIGQEIIHSEDDDFVFYVCCDKINEPYIFENDLLLVRKCRFNGNGFYAVSLDNKISFCNIWVVNDLLICKNYSGDTLFSDTLPKIIGKICEIRRYVL